MRVTVRATTDPTSAGPTLLYDAKVPTDLMIQAVAPVSLFISKNFYDLYQLDSAGNPQNGLLIAGGGAPFPMTRHLGKLWGACNVKTDVIIMPESSRGGGGQ